MARAMRPVMVDGTEFDALLEQQADYTAEIPEYPVEAGYKVSDTIILNPMTLSVKLFVTPYPVTWRSRFGLTITRVQDVISRLLNSYQKRELITVSTTDDTYKNMGISSISISKPSGNGYVREISLELKEVKVTTTQITDIPADLGKSGTSGATGGTSLYGTEASTLAGWSRGAASGNLFSSL